MGADERLRRFWARMAARYPAPTVGWAARLGEAPRGAAAAEWAETLRDLSNVQIVAALAADEKRGSDYPPSGPHFRRMALGIPDRRNAITSYQAGVVTPFTRLMRDHTDSWQLNHADYPQAERILAAAFEAAVVDVERAGGLPESEAPALAAPEQKPASAKPRFASDAVVGREFARMRAAIARAPA